MRSEGVGRSWIEWFIGAGLTIFHLHIAEPASAGNFYKCAGVVNDDGAWELCIDRVFQTGNLQEATAFSGADIHGTELERIQNLLAADFCKTRHVSKRMHSDDVAVGHIAGFDVSAHTAAVDKSDVSAHDFAIRIGAKISEIRFSRTHAALTGGWIVDGEINGGLGDHFFGDCMVFILDALNVGLRSGVRWAVGGDICDWNELCVHFTSSSIYRELADGIRFGAGLAENNVFAVSIFDDLFRLHCVRMAVEHCVDTGGVGDDVRAHPWLALQIFAEMRQRDDIICAISARGVNGILHAIVKLLAIFTLTETIDIIAVFILEESRRGF